MGMDGLNAYERQDFETSRLFIEHSNFNTLRSIAVGFVDVTSQDALLVSSDFLFDDNSWRLFTTPADAAYAGAPATERAVKHGLDSITDTSLSRYIFYDGDADGGHRWYFSSFINRNSVNLYGGVLSFDLYGFSGLFDDDSLYDTTKVIKCSFCVVQEKAMQRIAEESTITCSHLSISSCILTLTRSLPWWSCIVRAVIAGRMILSLIQKD